VAQCAPAGEASQTDATSGSCTGTETSPTKKGVVVSAPYDGHCRVCGKPMDGLIYYDDDGFVVCSDECADALVNGSDGPTPDDGIWLHLHEDGTAHHAPVTDPAIIVVMQKQVGRAPCIRRLPTSVAIQQHERSGRLCAPHTTEHGAHQLPRDEESRTDNVQSVAPH